VHKGLTAGDIWSLDQFISYRPELMKAVLFLKKLRRIHIGPHMTLLFENRELLWWQIQEMVRIEKGGDLQIQDELEAYLPLIPDAHGFTATLMVEVADAAKRPAILASLTGLESHIALVWEEGGSRQEVRSTSLALAHPYQMPRHKTTSVHFLQFPMTQEQRESFCRGSHKIFITSDHPHYQEGVEISPELINELTHQLQSEEKQHPADVLLSKETPQASCHMPSFSLDKSEESKHSTDVLLSEHSQASHGASSSSGGAKVSVAVVGATGNIGRCVVQQLQKWKGISLLLSASKTSTLTLDGHEHAVVPFHSLDPCQIYIFATQASVSRELIPFLLRQAHPPFVLDSSSAFRMDPQIPLMVPLLNQPLLTQEQKVYAHPNCVASPLALVLSPLLPWGIQDIFVSTYQSTSGAGWEAMNSCQQETSLVLKGESVSKNPYFPRTIAFNAFPQVGEYHEEGPTEEEQKIMDEVKKILSLTSTMHVTSVRVPTLQGHGMTISIKCQKTMDICGVKEAIARAPGITMSPLGYHSPLEVVGSDQVFVGRIRQTGPCHISLWVCSDNLRRGGATDLVETAHQMIQKFF
jgi:aspartate-semialdehyde dehydrogenase